MGEGTAVFILFLTFLAVLYFVIKETVGEEAAYAPPKVTPDPQPPPTDDVFAHEKVPSLVVRLAVKLAMQDGELERSEGLLVSSWIRQTLAKYTGAQREQQKAFLNDVLRSAYREEAANQSVSRVDLVRQIDKSAGLSEKKEILQLCARMLAVTSRDVEDRLLQDIAWQFGIPFEQIRGGQGDDSGVDRGPVGSAPQTLEERVGIGWGWDRNRITKYLDEEFRIWQSRSNTLANSTLKKSAKQRLDWVIEACKKYD